MKDSRERGGLFTGKLSQMPLMWKRDLLYLYILWMINGLLLFFYIYSFYIDKAPMALILPE
ncbi:hypothetical protein RchiOBHm_Chr7g0185101 [Rosa chinensis]|uniref:Uncharacterized protein n=1 Tax=Rosa chinensis TaxID=74649 RepID=A0A2P6P3L0_ROSCH|nr:hypothetical protein RchiOBHm_Chr7g0185101 [Rosa chinensis]